MKKCVCGIILIVFLMFPFFGVYANEGADAGSTGGGVTSSGCNGKDSCWPSVGKVNNSYKSFTGIRVTIFNSNAQRVSDSVDITINNVSTGINVKRTYINNTKIEHISSDSVTWVDGNLDDVILFNFGNEKLDSWVDTLYNTALSTDLDSLDNKVFAKKLNWCMGNYEQYCSDDTYYAVVEPTTVIRDGGTSGTLYYGTAYELAFGFYDKNWIINIIRKDLPNRIYLDQNLHPSFYSVAGLEKPYIVHNVYDNNGRYSKNRILKGGIGIGVFDWSGKKPNLKEDLTCNVTANINSCGNSEIKEDTRKECIVNNYVYSYVSGCNLYCSDEITSNFSGVYNTFIGNNKLKAIKSGTYLSMAGNSQITIKKTCYQSQTSNECPDASQSFRNKLNSDYKNNDIYLNVDGYRYSLNGTPSITNNGYDSATITYTYELNPTTNKYISIEEMKGIYSTVDSYKVIDNGVAKIITKKETYGNYSYSLDISNTALNKYHSASTNLTNYKNATSAEYNFENVITINKNGTAVDKYTTGDLNYSCGYVKYDASSSCICAENQCCDSITCEPVECPPSSCVCTGPYGCKNDGKCTPLPEPTGNGETCDPETSTCFPNIVYRPISLVDPFPGIDGTGRLPGDNWNRVVKIDGKYTSLVDFYIKNNRGVSGYEVYNKEPLYVIELDNTKMKAIRTYNKSHDYNDFELSCINGENCISDFLRGRANGFNINLISSGTCKNITNYDFNSCLE